MREKPKSHEVEAVTGGVVGGGAGGEITGGAEGARRATGAAPDGKDVVEPMLRMSVARKRDVVLRLMRGETLDALSRELKLPAGRISQWRDEFIAGGEAALKSRELDARDEQIRRQHSKIGELTMENELLRQKNKRMEAGFPLARWRSRR
jgi:transposase